MNFTTWHDFLNMGGHGIYVWSAYAIVFVIIAINCLMPVVARRRYLKMKIRDIRRENLN